MKRSIWSRIIAAGMAAALILGTSPQNVVQVFAETVDQADDVAQGEISEESVAVSADEIMINPLYQDILDSDAVKEELLGLQAESEADSGIAAFSLETRCESIEEAAAYVKDQMVARNSEITFMLNYDVYVSGIAKNIFYKAMEHTEDCAGWEGDALTWVWKGCSYGTSYQSDEYREIHYTITYYTDAAQEVLLTEAVGATMEELALDDASEYEKVKTIYNYVCNHVDYDYASTDYLKYTAYAALCKGKAVCQGYVVLFYRLCKEAGLSVRVITGTSGGVNHAWNIVRINGKYYNLDATWDGQGTVTNAVYFLKNEKEFLNHTREASYSTEEFAAAYPMAEDSWIDYTAFDEPYDLENRDWSFTTLDETTVTSAAEGRPKMLVFFKASCTNSADTISGIADYGFSDVDIIAVETEGSSKDTVASFAESYGDGTMEFSYCEGTDNFDAMWDYVWSTGTNSISYPYIVYIDANNKFQYASNGAIAPGLAKAYLKYYCEAEEEPAIVGVTEVSLSQTSASLTVGDTLQLIATVSPSAATDKTVSYTSSDPAVATVDSAGNVTAIAAGTVTVTVTAQDGSGKSAVCEVTVVKPYTGLRSEGGQWVYYKNGKKDNTKTGLVQYSGAWFYVKDGIVDKTATGFVEYDGSLFYVAKGQLLKNANGLVADGDDWYFVSGGQMQKQYSDLALYDGEWFVLEKGKLNQNYNGFYSYDGREFLVAAGQIQSSYSGLFQNEKDGKWYFIADGQVSDYSGLTMYDGAWFYILEGVLAEEYTGYVNYNGSRFYVVNGKIGS